MTDTPLRPGAHLDLELTDMTYGGDALGRVDGQVVFAWGGITGEQVTVTVEQGRRDIVRGRVTAVARPAPVRVGPPCPYFGPCGGCQWQHIAYPAQVEFKTHILREQLRRLGGLDPATLDAALQPGVGMADPWHYRNTATFQVEAVTRKLGYYGRDSHTVVPVAVCPISEPGINDTLAALQALIDQHAYDTPGLAEQVDLSGPVPVAMRERHFAGLLHITQVTIRSAPGHEATPGGEVMIVLHTQPATPARGAPARSGRDRGRGAVEPAARPAIHLARKTLRRWAEAQPGFVTIVEATAEGALEPVGISAAAGAALSDDSAGVTRRGAAGKREEVAPTPPLAVLHQRVAGLPYWVAPTAFFQVNTAQAETLVALVAAALPTPGDLLVDAYCGAGLFAFALLAQGRARRVIGIESDPAAIESARWTATLRGIPEDQARWVAGRVETTLPGLDLAPDVVLLDPPRTGGAPRLIDHLVRHPVPRLIYVSCDPSTLARDLKGLAPAYRLTRAQVVDLFPQTYHLETVAVLERAV